MTTIVDRIKACIARNPDWSNARVQSAIRGSSAGIVKAARDGTPLPEAASLSPGSITVAQVKQRYDTLGAILNEIELLPKGTLIPESELRSRVAKSDPGRFRRAIENNTGVVKAYRTKLKMNDDSESSYFWGHQNDIAEIERTKLS
jgi:hypothetical protein